MLNQSPSLDLTFKALGDPTRRSMLAQLTQGPSTVSELAQPLAISLPAVMQHLAVLECSGLVRSEKVGRVRTCWIELQALSFAEQWINQRRLEQEQQLERLATYLQTMQKEGEAGGKSE
jgi:DNA-binding transcriptional ArsR family regulator